MAHTCSLNNGIKSHNGNLVQWISQTKPKSHSQCPSLKCRLNAVECQNVKCQSIKLKFCIILLWWIRVQVFVCFRSSFVPCIACIALISPYGLFFFLAAVRKWLNKWNSKKTRKTTNKTSNDRRKMEWAYICNVNDCHLNVMKRRPFHPSFLVLAPLHRN